MPYSSTVHGERFSFADLAELLAKANERKSGDELAGLAAGSERERVAAKLALADVRISDFHDQPLVDDEVTAETRAAIAPAGREAIASLTVGQLRELVLAPQFPGLWETTLSGAFLPEVAAAVAKIMSDLDLVLAARSAGACSRTTPPTTWPASWPRSWTASATPAATRSSASTRPPTRPGRRPSSCGA